MVTKPFKLSNKNQTTIPESSRKLLGLKPHDEIRFVNNYNSHTVTIKKVPHKKRNVFDNPGFNRKNYLKFCRENHMKTDQDLQGKERWQD